MLTPLQHSGSSSVVEKKQITVEGTQVQCIHRVVDVQFQTSQVVEKTLEISRLQIAQKVVEIPDIRECGSCSDSPRVLREDPRDGVESGRRVYVSHCTRDVDSELSSDSGSRSSNRRRDPNIFSGANRVVLTQ